MKKIVLAATLAVTVLTPAVYAGDKIKISYEGSEQKIDVGDLKTTAVCTLKARVADMTGLSKKKFDLKKNGTKLSEDKTLYGSHVRNHNTVTVHPTGSSSQC